jgi:hypothetical protein
MISSKLILKIGGKEVSASQFGDKLTEAAMEIVKSNLRAKIEAVRCPVHNQNAEAVFEQGPGENFTYKVHGCCDALTDAVKKSLGTAG